MKNHIDLKHSLSVFNYICEHGERDSGKYQLEGVSAWHDFDGYTCYLQFNQVTLSMFFHGKYQLEYATQAEFNAFELKISRMKPT